jgi:protein SCO1
MAQGKRVRSAIQHALALAVLGAAAAVFAANGSLAHNGVVHESEEEARQHRALEENTAGFPNIKGGDFRLLDQTGATRTSKDPDGRFQLLFFGYATCKAICSVALPRMAEAVEHLESEGLVVTPVMITVDPERDTVKSLASAVPKIHPRMVGLTGSEKALEEAYRAFQVERKIVFEHPEHGAVYAHGSFIYLLAPDGTFRTLLPPILSAERMTELVREYMDGKK